jgi:myo-inositol 2-dehydrogenase/D-chiro-inositol 1-dehydrogenase
MTRTLRYGIVGAGMMGHEHIRNLELLPGAEVVAIADPNSESRWWAQQIADRPLREFSDVCEIVEDAEIDALVVATPNHTHRQILECIFDSDKSVLCEKPLCTTIEDARWVADRARQHQGVFWVGMEYRYMAPITRLIDEVHAGRIGALRMLAIREHRYPFLPKVGDWNRFARNTGGTFVEKCCHFFDLMRLVVQDEPMRVFASAGQDVNHLDELYDDETPDILDNGFVTVEFRHGARALLDLCMFAEASENEQEIAATGDLGKIEASIPDGRVVTGIRQPRKIESETLTIDADVLSAGAHFGSTFVEHQNFQRAIIERRPAAVTADDGLRAVAIGVAAEISARTGAAVDVEEVLAGNFIGTDDVA